MNRAIRSKSQHCVRSLGIRRYHADLFNPTPEHAVFRRTIRDFVEKEVDPQYLQYNRIEKVNWDLFHKLIKMGIGGLTVDPAYGGSGMDATAAVILAGSY